MYTYFFSMSLKLAKEQREQKMQELRIIRLWIMTKAKFAFQYLFNENPIFPVKVQPGVDVFETLNQVKDGIKRRWSSPMLKYSRRGKEPEEVLFTQG